MRHHHGSYDVLLVTIITLLSYCPKKIRKNFGTTLNKELNILTDGWLGHVFVRYFLSWKYFNYYTVLKLS